MKKKHVFIFSSVSDHSVGLDRWEDEMTITFKHTGIHQDEVEEFNQKVKALIMDFFQDDCGRVLTQEERDEDLKAFAD